MPAALIPLLLLGTMVAQSASAQTSWTESGYVQIYVYANGTGPRFGRQAEDVLETDVVDEIAVGDGGLIATRRIGTLSIAGVGSAETSRALGEVEVDYGTLTINGSFVDGDIDLGVSTFSQFHEPSPGDLMITLSEMTGDIYVGNGTLGASASRLDDVTVNDLGHAVIDNCTIDYISGDGVSGTDGSEIDITNSHVTAGLPNYRGDVFISNSSLESVMGTIVDGTIQIGSSGEPVVWDASNTITVGGGTYPTDLVVTDSSIDSAISILRGSGATSVRLQGASVWRAATRFQIQSAMTTLHVRSGSRVESVDALWIGAALVEVGSTVAASSRIDVGGNLDLGRFTEVNFSSGGTLTIEDGGVVDVDGTLHIHSPAVLNLEPGGVLRVGALVNDGTLNENGGTLIVPEPGAAMLGGSVLLALAVLCRGRTRRRSHSSTQA
jgi:hypothetical protein